jgi:uroporphyrinogen-III synthase
MSASTIFLLSTRILPPSLTEAAAARGMQLDSIAFIRTELLPAGPVPEGPITAVFTSQHAVEALPRMPREWKIFCLGGATRRQVEIQAGGDRIAGTAASAEELAAVMIGAETEREVLFFCGEQRLDILPSRLRQAGFTVQERVVYRTIQTPQRVERTYAGIAFFSPSGVESFFSVNSIREETTLFSIGRTTAAALLARTGRKAIVASRPDKEVLIQEMIAQFTL